MQANTIVENCHSEDAQNLPQIATALYCLGEADRPYDDAHATRIISKRNLLNAKLAQVEETSPMRRYTVELMSSCASGIPVRSSITDEMIASLQSTYRVRFRTSEGDYAAKVCDALKGPIVVCDNKGTLADIRLKKFKRDVDIARSSERVAYNGGSEKKANPEFPPAQTKVRSAERALVSLERRASSAKQECARNKKACPKSESLEKEVSAARSELANAKADLKNTPEFSERQIIRHKNLRILDYTYTYRFALNVLVAGQKVISDKRNVEFTDRVVPAFPKGNIEGDPVAAPTNQQAFETAATNAANDVSNLLRKRGLELANSKPCDDWGCTMRDRLLNSAEGLKVGPWPEWSVHDIVRCQPAKE